MYSSSNPLGPAAMGDDGRMNYLLHMIGAMLVIFRIELLIPDSWP